MKLPKLQKRTMGIEPTTLESNTLTTRPRPIPRISDGFSENSIGSEGLRCILLTKHAPTHYAFLIAELTCFTYDWFTFI